MRRQRRAELTQLGEVAQERPPVAGPECELAAVVLEDAAEAVPLRLVAPLALPRQLGDELRLHRWERDVGAWRVRHGRASLAAVRRLIVLLAIGLCAAGCGGGANEITVPKTA